MTSGHRISPSYHCYITITIIISHKFSRLNHHFAWFCMVNLHFPHFNAIMSGENHHFPILFHPILSLHPAKSLLPGPSIHPALGRLPRGQPAQQPPAAAVTQAVQATQKAQGSEAAKGVPCLKWFIPSGKHTKSYWKWPFIVDFSHEKWWFSIAMLNYQRVMVHTSMTIADLWWSLWDNLWENGWAFLPGKIEEWIFLAGPPVICCRYQIWQCFIASSIVRDAIARWREWRVAG